MVVLPRLEQLQVVGIGLDRQLCPVAALLHVPALSQVDAAEHPGGEQADRDGAHTDPAPEPIHEASLPSGGRCGYPPWRNETGKGNSGPTMWRGSPDLHPENLFVRTIARYAASVSASVSGRKLYLAPFWVSVSNQTIAPTDGVSVT